jgi:mono/diheme cytochrome c family protein
MPAIRRLVVFVMSLLLPLIAAGSGAGHAVAASQAATDPLIARGRYMVVTGQCNNCHTERYQQTAGRVPPVSYTHLTLPTSP